MLKFFGDRVGTLRRSCWSSTEIVLKSVGSRVEALRRSGRSSSEIVQGKTFLCSFVSWVIRPSVGGYLHSRGCYYRIPFPGFIKSKRCWYCNILHVSYGKSRSNFSNIWRYALRHCVLIVKDKTGISIFHPRVCVISTTLPTMVTIRYWSCLVERGFWQDRIHSQHAK